MMYNDEIMVFPNETITVAERKMKQSKLLKFLAAAQSGVPVFLTRIAGFKRPSKGEFV